MQLPSKNLLVAISVIAWGSSLQYGYAFAWTNSAQTVMMEFLQTSFNSSYGSELSTGGLSLLWSTIITTKSLGLIIGAEVSKWAVPRQGSLLTLRWNCIVTIIAALMQQASVCKVEKFRAFRTHDHVDQKFLAKRKIKKKTRVLLLRNKCKCPKKLRFIALEVPFFNA